MLKNLISKMLEMKIDFNSNPIYYVSDEDLKYALCGIDIIKEITSDNERLCNL